MTGALGTLGTNATNTVTLTVVPRSVGSITNRATVSSDNADLNTANNTNLLAVTVLPLPLLALHPNTLNAQQLVVSWPALLTNFQLEFRNGIVAPENWSSVATVPTVVGSNKFVIETNRGPAKFYRLKD